MIKQIASFVALMFTMLVLHSQAMASYDIKVIDLSGNSIPGVTITLTYTTQFPAINPGTYTYYVLTDQNGIARFGPSCSLTPCCWYTSDRKFTISKPGFQFSHDGGLIKCGFINDYLLVTGTDMSPIKSFSAASYTHELTSDMIVASFGSNLSDITESATLPISTTLASRRILITDSSGAQQFARLLFVSPSQINYLMPPNMTDGPGTVRLLNENDQVINVGFMQIFKLSPSIFTANGNGQGVPAAVILRVGPDDQRVYEPIAEYDVVTKRYVPIPIDIGPESEFVVLSLFGTGWRHLSLLTDVRVTIGNVECPVEYAGLQPTIEGLDQINIRLPRRLIGIGLAVLVVFVDGRSSNNVQIWIK